MTTIKVPDGRSFEVQFIELPFPVGFMRNVLDESKTQGLRSLMMLDTVVAGVFQGGKEIDIDDLPHTAIEPIIEVYNSLFMSSPPS